MINLLETASSIMDDPDEPIGFKVQPRYTAVDYRAQLALKSDDIRRFRSLCTSIEEEEKFEIYLIILMHLVSKEQQKDKSSSTIHPSTSMMNNERQFPDIMTDSNNDIDMDVDIMNDLDDNTKDSDDITKDSDDIYQKDYFDDIIEEITDSLEFHASDPIRDYLSDSLSSGIPIQSVFGNDSGSINIFVGNRDTFSIGFYETLITTFSVILGCSIIDLNRFCENIIDLTVIRRSDWDAVELTTTTPKKNRTIDDLGAKCYPFTRFTVGELHILKEKFFGKFPTQTFSWYSNVFTFEEVLLIALHYMAHGTPYTGLAETYGGDWSKYSLMVNFFARFLFHKYYHRLSGKSLEYWADNVPLFREKIWKYVCFDDDGEQIIDIALDEFRIWSYIDCTQHVTCQPGSGPIDAEDNRREDIWTSNVRNRYGNK